MRECVPVGKFLYRVHDTHVEIYKATDYTFCNKSETFCYRYRVLSVTEHGAWIERDGGKKFVMLDARKKFACETIDLAIKSFKARKARQLRYLMSYVNRIRAASEAVDRYESHKIIPSRQDVLTNILD